MDTTFTNTAAAVLWIVAIVEIISFIVYVSITWPKTRRKIVSMGRLIPVVQMLVVVGGIPYIQTQSVQVTTFPSAPSTHQYNTQMPLQQPPPQQQPPSGFYKPQDDPPPYPGK